MKPFFAHINLPLNTEALLFDMDGVLLDSLELDQQLLGPLFSHHLGRPVALEPEFIKSIFAYDPARFVELIFDHLEKTGEKIPGRGATAPKLLEEYLGLRRTTPMPLLPGAREALDKAKELGFKRALVSNNPLAEVQSILKRAGLDGYFSEVVGNDMSHAGKVLRKKPEPDCYLYAAEKLAAKPEDCAVFEDSVLGCLAGHHAGMHVIGLLTGSATLHELRGLYPPPQIFPNLTEEAA